MSLFYDVCPLSDGSTFRVTIPVNELLGIDMGPVMADVKVRRDLRRNTVTMFIEGVTFGKPELDRLLSIRLRLFLFSTTGRRNWMPFRRRNSPQVDSFLEDVKDLQLIKSAGVPLQQLDEISSATPTDDSVSSDSDSLTLQSYDSIQIEVDSPPQGQPEIQIEKEKEESRVDEKRIQTDANLVRLNCAVQLRLNVAIPPVLAFVPKIIIGSAGRIILRHMVNGALPNLLDLIVTDYCAWANGEPRDAQKGRGLFRFKDANTKNATHEDIDDT